MKAKNHMRPVHPGEILRQELDELGLSANALSKALGVPVNRVTMILNGQRGVRSSQGAVWSAASPWDPRTSFAWTRNGSVLDMDGTLHASLGKFPTREVFMSALFGGELNHPLGRRAVGAVWGNLVAVGVQTSYEIKAFAADGSLVRIVRRAWEPRTPTKAEYDARAPGGVPPVDAYPALDEILADRLGHLWVREYRMSGEEAAVWTVFDSEGQVQGLVETPVGLSVFEIGEDYVLGTAKDEMGVEYVQVWELSRGVG